MRQEPEHIPDLTIEFKARPEFLAVLRGFVRCFTKHLNLTPEEALQLEICVDEACANSIEHSLAHNSEPFEARIKIELHVLPDHLHLTVQDQGQDFSNHFDKALPLSDFSDRTRMRGYGLQIIKTLMDDVHYHYDPSLGNRLCLIKYFKSGL
ncbi:MAG: ATP-binding protein [bacterium]